MASAGSGSVAAGGGRWEVVRKGRRPAGGPGNRRALGEANAGRTLALAGKSSGVTRVRWARCVVCCVGPVIGSVASDGVWLIPCGALGRGLS